jgi:hypothetical protein
MLIGVGSTMEDSLRDKRSSRVVGGRLWFDAPNSTHIGVRFGHWWRTSYPMLIGAGSAMEDSLRDKGSSRVVDGRL